MAKRASVNVKINARTNAKTLKNRCASQKIKKINRRSGQFSSFFWGSLLISYFGLRRLKKLVKNRATHKNSTKPKKTEMPEKISGNNKFTEKCKESQM